LTEVRLKQGPRNVDRAALERAAAELIRALALDPAAQPELAESPARMADYLLEACAGAIMREAPEFKVFPHSGGDEVVVVRDLTFHSLCVHHFAPFFGRALVAYLPDASILGLSGIARLVDFHARRPQLQERLTRDIADQLEQLVRPRGVAVVLEARHLCMEMRGERRSGTVETRMVRGALADPRYAEVLRPLRPGS
jgi:GTP cyclohydrolase I